MAKVPPPPLSRPHEDATAEFGRAESEACVAAVLACGGLFTCGALNLFAIITANEALKVLDRAEVATPARAVARLARAAGYAVGGAFALGIIAFIIGAAMSIW